MIPTTAEWQFVGDDTWFFGVKVRGCVRKPIAEVFLCDNHWYWDLLEDIDSFNGKNVLLYEAIDAAEKAMGLS